jgi:MerR family transcriptional regulator, light-induced transcriptional regulator
MTLQNEKTQHTAGEVTYRSGAAARLAGLSVETLRVWERRYDLSDTRRSPHGQRLYSAEQVQRLSLLKQLVDQGHPIGQIAQLPFERLRELAGGAGRAHDLPAGQIGVVVVGMGLARRIASTSGDALLLDVQASCSRVDQPDSLPQGVETDVLLVELPEVDESVVPLIATARSAVGAAAVVVLYRFCSSATIRALRAQGWLAARVPAEMGELVPLCRQALAGQRLPPRRAADVPAVPAAPPPRRFDDDALATITAAGNRMTCECPRHLSELLMMVGSFERYSAQCASRNAADARLHEDLGHAAAQARVVLEGAMERLARAEDLPLPPALRRTGT